MGYGSRMLPAGLALLVTCGCATNAGVEVEPFDEYHAAFSELGASAETALAFEREWAYDNYMAALEAGGFESPGDVILEFPAEDGHPFAWSLPNAPIFLTLRKTEARLARINDLFAEYTSLLVTLAGGESDDAARIESLAEDLNANSRSAGRALGLDVDAEHTALFATAAAAAANAYLANQRADELREVLEENQPAVDAFAQLGAEAAELSAIGLHDEYQDATQRWIQRVIDAPDQRRAELVAEQLELNERTIAQLDGLEQIHGGYLALAETHAELARTLGGDGSVDIEALAARAREVRDLYRRLREEPDTDRDAAPDEQTS